MYINTDQDCKNIVKRRKINIKINKRNMRESKKRKKEKKERK